MIVQNILLSTMKMSMILDQGEAKDERHLGTTRLGGIMMKKSMVLY